MIRTEPERGELGVPVDKKLKICFNLPMDTATVSQGAVTFEPSLTDGFEATWDASLSEVILSVRDTLNDLQYSTRYTVTLSDEIKDTTGARLDGDGDGEPGGDYKFYFTTRDPQVNFTITPSIQTMKRGERREYEGVFTSREPRPLRLQLSALPPVYPGVPGWWHSLNQEVVEIGARGQVNVPGLLTICSGQRPIQNYHPVTVTGEVWSGNVLARNPARAKATGILARQPVNPNDPTRPGWPGGPGVPGHDQGLRIMGADDNWSVSDPQYHSPWLFADDSPVGLLLEGFYESCGHLLGRYGIATVGVESESLKVLSSYDRRLSDLKVLIVPTGALEDVRNNSLFWQGLEEYVQGGGYLMVLDQPYGDLYSRLPGSPQARGWEEDLSCTGLFTLLQENDPVVHGQRYKQCRYPTDGYFTWLPPGTSKHAIRILRGGAASAITYHYGQGRVFATTCYIDQAWGVGQWSFNDGRMLGVAITCGLYPERVFEVLQLQFIT